MDYFRQGIILFNEGRYKEAHEIWEAVWLLVPSSPRKRFLQGLIMIAAALYKYGSKEYPGMERLMTRGLILMRENGRDGFSMNSGKFIAGIESFLDDCRAGNIVQGEQELPKIESDGD